VDDDRIYVTGHSNGGVFTYVLMAARHDELAAVAPSGSLDRNDIRSFKPLPVFHSAGAEDPLVKFEWQQKMIQFLLSLNHCESNGTKDGNLTTYKSDIDMPVVTYIYNGGHKFPPEVPPEIVKFFKSQKRATTQPSRD
jgi:polyhydroxybutyrate depolymerase